MGYQLLSLSLTFEAYDGSFIYLPLFYSNHFMKYIMKSKW